MRGTGCACKVPLLIRGWPGLNGTGASVHASRTNQAQEVEVLFGKTSSIRLVWVDGIPLGFD